MTTTLDAAPHHRYDLGGESIWPFLLAVGVAATLMLGGIFNPWFVPSGASADHPGAVWVVLVVDGGARAPGGRSA